MRLWGQLSPMPMPASSPPHPTQRGPHRERLVTRWTLLALAAVIFLGAPTFAATKRVQVGPSGLLVFADEETGTNTTTITAGDTVEWIWAPVGPAHSTTRTDTPQPWDSAIQNAPFTFSQTFPNPGTFPYFCIPHQALGMVGTVIVKRAPVTTTTVTAATSTTVPLAPSIAQAFASLDQDLQALLDQVSTSAVNAPLGTSLRGSLQNARTRLGQAESALMAGRRGSAKRSLSAVNRSVKRFQAHVGSRQGHVQIPPSVRNLLLGLVGTAQGDLRSLRTVI